MRNKITHGLLIIEISPDHAGWKSRLEGCLPGSPTATCQVIQGHHVASIAVERSKAAQMIAALLEEFDHPGFAYR